MGDRKKLKRLKKQFQGMYPQLCLFAFEYLQDLEVCQDIVQEVFLEVWDNKITFLNENQMTGYYYKRVVKYCIAYLRSHPEKIPEGYDEAKLDEMAKEDFYFARAVAIETKLLLEQAKKK